MRKNFHWFFRISITHLFLLICTLGFGNILTIEKQHSFQKFHLRKSGQERDTLQADSVAVDTVVIHSTHPLRKLDVQRDLFQIFGGTNDSLDLDRVSRLPFISVQQLLKGNVPGTYVQENNGEPGTIQSMLIRGLSSPIFTNKDVSGVQPVVFLNGIPLIQDHPFVYEVQQYDVNPIGPANNLLAAVDLDNIKSIKVIKDPVELAKLGPLAANGAIVIVTKNGEKKRSQIIINSYIGAVAPPFHINPTNAGYEKTFRNKFYDAYAVPESERSYPDYLMDESDNDYFGNSGWVDSYYQYAPKYNFNVAISGGASRADFRFVAGMTSDAGNADKTSSQKTNVALFVNMEPILGMNIRCMLSGESFSRDRNRNFRDRFAEMEYLPDLSSPMPPSKNAYKHLLDEYGEQLDDNSTDAIQGYVTVDGAVKRRLQLATKLMYDYNDNSRGIFWPSTLLESVNYISNYTGYNSRIIWSNKFNYDLPLNDDHHLNFNGSASMQNDTHHYNYQKAFDGPNDYNKSSSNGSYVLYRYSDEESSRLASVVGTVNYLYKDRLTVGLTFRYDGSTEMQSDDRWLFSPAATVKWNLKSQFMADSKVISGLTAGVSWARVGKLIGYNRYALGPQYSSVDLNWEGQSLIPSYNGYASITRPYSYGWIGYDMGWPYTDKRNLNINGSLFKNRLDLNINLYDNYDKDMIIRTPVPQEYGYEYQYQSGMEVNNRGIDLSLSTAILSNPDGLNWDMTFNMNYNWNKLKKLPNGLNEVEIDGRKLQVGKSIDQFWVYKNKGIYKDDGDVPVGTDGSPLSMNGVFFHKGDPEWADVDGNNVIDSKDKVLEGHSTPPFTGGFFNQFRYKKVDLSFHFFFATGHSALNCRSSQRYDFMTLDNQNSLDAVKEVFFWQNTNDKNDYPIYNPLSEVHPYRKDQDLFLESLSYLKLRTVSMGYTFTMQTGKKNKKTGKREKRENNAYLYLTANNLWTWTNFSGDDPELVNFNGYYTGYSLPIPRSIILGFRLKL